MSFFLYNKTKLWKNIHMSILIILLVLIFIILFWKCKISIYVKIENIDIFMKFKFGFIEIKRKVAIVKRKRKYLVKKDMNTKLRKMGINRKSLKHLLKKIEITKLNINLILGTPFIFPSVFSVPIIAILLESLKTVHLKKLENYSYTIMPEYNEFKLFIELDGEIRFRVIDLVMFLFKERQNIV